MGACKKEKLLKKKFLKENEQQVIMAFASKKLQARAVVHDSNPNTLGRSRCEDCLSSGVKDLNLY